MASYNKVLLMGNLTRDVELKYTPSNQAVANIGLADAPLDPPAEHADREAMYSHLERALQTIGYVHGDSVVPIMRRLRRLLGRASMTSREVALLRGMARQILWVAGEAGLETASPRGPGCTDEQS